MFLERLEIGELLLKRLLFDDGDRRRSQNALLHTCASNALVLASNNCLCSSAYWYDTVKRTHASLMTYLSFEERTELSVNRAHPLGMLSLRVAFPCKRMLAMTLYRKRMNDVHASILPVGARLAHHLDDFKNKRVESLRVGLGAHRICSPTTACAMCVCDRRMSRTHARARRATRNTNL